MELTDIMAAFRYAGENGVGPSTLFSEARTVRQWEVIRTSPFFHDLLQAAETEARVYLNQPIRALPYSKLKLFETTGSRQEYEFDYFEHRKRLHIFAVLSLIYDDPRYRAALEDTIWAICDEYTWCLPAHLKDHSRNMAEAVPEIIMEQGILRQKLRDQELMLDLFAAETGFALAEILSLLEARIAPLVVVRARREIFRRILEPYTELGPALWWETSTMNWASVCAGSIGAAALYLIEDDLVLAPVLRRVVDTMDCYLKGFGEDGACTEGISYWTYGFGFFTYFAALLKQRTAGRLDLLQGDKVRRIALFQQRCYMTANYVVSFSDAELTANFMPGLTHYLKSVFPEVEIPERQYQSLWEDDTIRRWPHLIRNIVWSDSRNPSGLTAEGTDYFPDAQWLISRRKLGANRICFAAKAGHNDEPHNHNDLGGFILYINGDSLFADIGRGEYTRQYFGPERYEFFCAGSRGHSVPEVAGAHQKAGRQYAARVIETRTDATKDMMVMEIAPAYGDPNLGSLVRRFDFIKAGDPELILNDSYQFLHPAPVTERLISFYQPLLMADGRIRLEGPHSCLEILTDAEICPEIHCEPFVSHEGIPYSVYQIDYKLNPTEKRANFECRLVVKL